MTMTIEELTKIADAIEITDEMVMELQKSLEQAEKEFEEEARRKQITQEWLNRGYSW